MDNKEAIKKMVELNKRYVRPHDKISRDVTEKDIKRVLKDAQDMFNMCFVPVGHYNTFFAIAHPQIDDKDPLRFFVTREQNVIINPVITRHTQQILMKVEGCATFPTTQPKMVGRFYKIEVEYRTITPEGKLSEPVKSALKALEAEIWQHEIDHMDAKYIYHKTETEVAVKVKQPTQ